MGKTAVAIERKAGRLDVPSAVKTPSNKPEVPEIELPPVAFGYLPLSVVNSGNWHTFGLVADTHLCCKEERLDALHSHYDLMESEGITTVFHAGNIIDGYVHRINGGSVFSCTIDGQSQYVADNYPQRKGMTTYFITGDDHESWFAPGFNIGAYIQHVCKKAGREDLVYLGHVEADVELKTGAAESTIIRIAHPGGGSAYSRSYTAQKIVESYEGGEKPDILVNGHYHVGNYMPERNIHVVNMPGFQEQTIFGRKKRLRMEVGGGIISFKVRPEDGSVTRFRHEFNMYYNRGYYKTFLRSDAQLVKGHLVISQ